MRPTDSRVEPITAEKIRSDLAERGIMAMPLNVIARATELGLADTEMDEIIDQLLSAEARH
jgi:hypothetical protein